MSSISSAAPSSGTAPAGLFGKAGGDFDLFLKLLTTQMQNQDPLDPMDTSQYTQQLVQYSQVEQSLQQTSVLKEILSRLTGDDLGRAGQMIGRTAEFNSSVSGLAAGQPAQWRWSLPQAPASLEAEILDSSGRVVARPSIAPGTGGTLQWDGALPGGTTAEEGAYVLKLTARDASGAAIPATLTSIGRVQEVSSREGEMWIGIGGVSLPSDTLVRIAA